MRFALSTPQLLTAASLAGAFLLLSHKEVHHTDVWGHLRFGEVMVQQHHLPTREGFSGDFADQDAPYINYQWLAQAGGYLVYDLGRRLAGPDHAEQVAGGAVMLSGALAVVVTLRLLVLFAAFRRLCGSDGAALAGVLLAFGLGVFHHVGIVRPQALGELGFALLLLALSRPAMSWWAVAWVPFVVAVWANCHGSFPMGLVLIGAFAAGRAWDVLAGPGGGGETSGAGGAVRSTRYAVGSTQYPAASTDDGARSTQDVAPGTEHSTLGIRHWVPGTRYSVLGTGFWSVSARRLGADPQLRRLVLVLFLSVAAAALLNPHGPALFRHGWELSRHPNIAFMDEWKPLSVRTLSGYAFLASVLLVAVLVRLSPRRFTATQVILLAGFGLQSMAHARVLAWWFMVLAWVAVPHLHAVGQLYLARAGTGDSRRRRGNAVAAALAVVGCLALSAPALWAAHSLPRTRPATPTLPQALVGRVTDVTPFNAAEYLKQEYARDSDLGRTIFTSETMGDYLLWDLRLDPPVRMFCYTHVHLLTPEHWKECMIVKVGDRRWQEVLDRHGVQFLIVERDLYEPLVEQVLAAPDRWQVATDRPVFVAKRVR